MQTDIKSMILHPLTTAILCIKHSASSELSRLDREVGNLYYFEVKCGGEWGALTYNTLDLCSWP